jgi:hypothetical protein
MIRFLRAFIWLRWRLLLNAFRRRSRRDTLERLSRALSVLVPIALGLLLVPASLTLGLLAFFAGRLMGSGEIQAAPVLLAVRIILLAGLGTVLLVPLGRSSQGLTSGVSRLLLLPIPRRALHAVEVCSGILDPWIVFLLPGLALLPVGLVSARRPLAGLVAFVASVALVGVVACAGATAQFSLHWLVRDRRRAEVLSLLFVLVMSTAGPMFALLGDPDRRERAHPDARPSREVRVQHFDRELPSWTLAIPTELYARTVREGTSSRFGLAALGVAGMAVQAGLLFSLSAMIHGKLLDRPASSRSFRASRLRIAPAFRLAGVSPAASAVAETYVRVVLRSVRGKLAVFFPGPFLLVFGFLLGRTEHGAQWAGAVLEHGHAIVGFGILLGFLALQPVLLNQFVIDRAGLTLQFLTPASERDLVVGKALGGAALYGISLTLSFLAALALAPRGSPLTWLAALLGGLSTYVLAAPVSALVSAVFPHPADLNRIGSGGSNHGMAGFIATLWVATILAPPSLIILVCVHQLSQPGFALVLMLGWTAIAAAIARLVLNPTVEVVARRKENLLMVAAGR